MRLRTRTGSTSPAGEPAPAPAGGDPESGQDPEHYQGEILPDPLGD